MRVRINLIIELNQLDRIERGKVTGLALSFFSKPTITRKCYGFSTECPQ